MLLGYARVSTDDQKLDLQIAALTAAGVEPDQIKTDMASGCTTSRPGLTAAIKAAREGDVIVVWRLDRIAHSIRDLLNIVDQLKARKVGLRSLTHLRRGRGVRAQTHPGTHHSRAAGGSRQGPRGWGAPEDDAGCRC